MPFDLVFSYPSWYLILCLALASLYTYLLYSKNRFSDKKHKNYWVYPMATFRFIAIFFLSVLLLNPLLKYFHTTEEKPLIVFVEDNSQSIIGNKDSNFIRKEYLSQLGKIKSNIAKKYDVKTLFLGSTIHEADSTKRFSEKESNLSSMFPYLDNAYDGRNIGAVVFATDGIFTSGENPAQKSLKSRTTVHTIALGDTTEYKDQRIKSVKYNEVAFLGDEYPLRIELQGIECAGSSSTITVYEGKEKLFSKSIRYTTQNDYLEELIYLQAKSPGSKHLTVQVSALDGERSLANNRRDIFFDVLDSRKKIKLVYSGPHPDIAAIQRAVQSNKNYQFESEPYSTSINLQETDLLILHNLPNNIAASGNLLSLAENSKTPILFIVGHATNTRIFQQPKYGCAFYQRGGNSEVQTYINPNFNDFIIEEEYKEIMANWPPLQIPYGNYRLAPDATVVMKQKIGTVNTQNPLMLFSKKESGNIGVLFGDGIWKWRISTYAETKNFDAFDDWIGKTIQYLATHKDTRKFRVLTDKELYYENEPIYFQATLLNNNNEPITNQDIKLVAKHSDGTNYPFNFSKTESGYSLNAGLLPIGDYNYTANTSGGLRFNGKFKVLPLQNEFNDLKANHLLLKELANFNNGKHYTLNNLASLEKEILESSEIKNTLITEKNLEEIIHKKWIFVLLLLLLSAEWFLRKREGSY